ncbi:MAG TPA: VWA domain-containing protein [Polyangiaceae bacterium]
MGHLPSEGHGLSARLRRVLWGASIALVGLVLVLLYQRLVGATGGGALSWVKEGVRYELVRPTLLGVLLVTPLLMFVLGRSLADLPWPQRLLALLFRVAFLALIALSLARLVRTDDAHRVATVLLVDVSDSVSDQALGDAKKTIEAFYANKGREDVLRVVTFAERSRRVEIERNGKLELPASLRHAPRGKPDGASTNIEGALELAYGLFPPGYLKRAVVVSDGVETEGNLLAEAGRARALGVRLWAVPYRRPLPPEVAVVALRLPDKVDVGQSFDVSADVYASRAAKVRAKLYQGEALNGIDGVREVELKPGPNEIKFQSVVRVGGEVTYDLKLEPEGADEFKENNGYAATLDVPGRPAVLYVEGQPQRASYFANALGTQQFDVDIRAPAAFPASLRELERYDFITVSDVPREALNPAAQDLVEKYVRDLGGGFLFAGGDAGYGLGGWAHTTFERMLPVRMDAERRKEMPDVAMMLVIDRSGSMTGLPMEMAKAACIATLGALQPDDLLEVIAFDSTPVRYVKLQQARYRSRIQNDVERIQPGGGTEIFQSLDMAYQDLSVVRARRKHVILLTDGQASEQGIRDLVQAMVASSITVTTVGLGEGVKQDLLRTIADTGGGRFHYVPDPNSLPKIFTRETEMVSQQAAVDEWFPVEQVGSAEFLKGVAIGSAPLLHGYVATELKPPPAQLILQSDRGDPILARWRVGLGWAVAWTSDVKNHWAVDWLRWSGYPKFWGQLVREHMRVKRRRELDMKTEVVGSRVRATVDAFTADERFDDGVDSKLFVSPAGKPSERREVAMKQVAPGRYEADFELTGYGSYVLRAEHARRDADGNRKPFATSTGRVSNPYPREYSSFEPDIEKLTRAAAVGGGSVDPTPAAVFDPGNEKITYQKDLWSRFVLAAIVVFLLDLLVRRVRLFDRKAVAVRRGSLPPSRPSVF